MGSPLKTVKQHMEEILDHHLQLATLKHRTATKAVGNQDLTGKA